MTGNRNNIPKPRFVLTTHQQWVVANMLAGAAIIVIGDGNRLVNRLATADDLIGDIKQTTVDALLKLHIIRPDGDTDRRYVLVT